MNTIIIKDKFKKLYASEPILVRSPGRINLIGEHTDYNDGFVFPAAIDKEICFAVAKNNVGKFRFHAIDLNEDFELDIEALTKTDTAWANYLLGVAAQFIKYGHKLSGVDCVFGGDIPMGAGLSSSAAIENGFAFALNEIFDINLSKLEIVKIAQKAEHEYAGVMCGIMDQFASMHGKKNNALKLDCRSLDFEYANINLSDYGIVLCDTKVKHELASSAYNTRREECETGVKILQKYNKNITALRDVTIQLLQEHKEDFHPIVYKRCEYVINENTRVENAFDALQKNDILTFGKLMYQSHEGLRDSFEVSCRELDILFDIAKDSDEVVGSRMMGGGFGGCTINLVKYKEVDSFMKKTRASYKQVTGIEPDIFAVEIVDGTGLV